MRLFSYIVKSDSGFAPNPFWGYCTLADCKPSIRRTALVGDWIVGLSPKASGNRLIYAMRVGEVLSFEQYFHDKRFAAKIPDYSKPGPLHKCGDNIYEPLPDGNFRQLRSTHSNGLIEDPDKKKHDLCGRNVLVSAEFVYFGAKGPDLPSELGDLIVGRGHKCRFAQETIKAFIRFIENQPRGILGPPKKWPSKDDSWQLRTKCG